MKREWSSRGILSAALLLARAALSQSPGAPAGEPAAIVYSISGSAAWGATADRKPLKLFDWIRAGSSVEIAEGSTVGLAFTDGSRYEMGSRAAATVQKSMLASPSGPVRRLPSVPSLPHLARLLDSAGSKPAAVRIRGAGISEMYPRAGAATLADATVLRFEPVEGAVRYEVEVTDENGSSVVRRETTATTLSLPSDLLRPAARYGWTVRAFDHAGVVSSARERIDTVDAQAARSRAALDESLRRAGDADSLALLAGVDRDLGLLWEAAHELRLAVERSPREEGLKESLEQLDDELGIRGER